MASAPVDFARAMTTTTDRYCSRRAGDADRVSAMATASHSACLPSEWTHTMPHLAGPGTDHGRKRDLARLRQILNQGFALIPGSQRARQDSTAPSSTKSALPCRKRGAGMVHVFHRFQRSAPALSPLRNGHGPDRDKRGRAIRLAYIPSPPSERPTGTGRGSAGSLASACRGSCGCRRGAGAA